MTKKNKIKQQEKKRKAKKVVYVVTGESLAIINNKDKK